jgi:glycosyltransferase involved in cell wall biosynthesis
VTRSPTVAIVGDSARPTAYASINQVWAEALSRSGVDVTLVPSTAVLDRRFDRVLHHDYQQYFGDLERPDTDRFVVVRTWDFGPYPRRWTEVVDRHCDELWVHSRWTAEQARAGGVDAAKIQVVPNGVDPRLHAAHGPSFRFDTGTPAADPGRFVFLFVGAAVARKGVDILLEAYGRAFDRSHPVTLVIKDWSGDVFYQGITLGERIAAFRARAGAPDLLHLDAYLEAAQLAALYRRSDAGVFPYRAEGFAMPILEAMACGTPSIVPRFGACLDFCDDDCAFLVPARRIRLPVERDLRFNTLGFHEVVEEVDFCEVDPDVLAAEMRRVVGLGAQERARVGAAAAQRARAFSWERSVERVRDRLLL